MKLSWLPSLILGITCLTLAVSAASTFAAPGPQISARKDASPEEASRMRAACPKFAFLQRQNYGMTGTNAIMFARRTGVGSAICVYDPATPDIGPKTIFQTDNGFILNMNPSYDGSRLVFSYKEANHLPFHVWEINIDGTGLRQVTKGDYHDFSPVYYPDGRIVFCSSRVESFSLCQDFLACALHIVNGDGSDLRRIDHTTLCTLTPAILPNGSILCTRWEYQDKNIFGWQGLWTIHPNGRNLQLYHGNTFRVPNAVYGARPVPGTNKVICTWAAHHHIPIGEIGMIDRSLGLESPESMWKVTDVTPYEKDVATPDRWRITGTGGIADTLFYEAFCDPYPFTRDYTLVSFGGDTPPFHGLYILNHTTGETTPILSLEGTSCFGAVPIESRQPPQTIPGEAPVEKGYGVFFCQDVYQGLLEQDVPRGMVKKLRIFSQSPKKYNTEGPRYHDHYPIVGQGTYYVKEYYGTAPVDENGSAFFIAPSNTELYFSAVDQSGKEIQRMGSVTQITTGEMVTCIGCHENRLKPPPAGVANFTRMRRPPDRITPPAWGAGPVNYATQVQPVLDRHCVKCHGGGDPPAGIDLTGDRSRFYSMSYISLVYKDYVDYYYINRGPNGNFPALQTGSWTSRLTAHLEKGHNEIVLSPEELDRLYVWIDANVPYYGTWDMTRPWSTGGRDLFAFTTPGRVDENTGRFIRGRAQLYGWVEQLNEAMTEIGLQANPMIDGEVNFSRPELSPMLTRNLAKSAGGACIDDRAMFKSKEDSNYKSILNILNEANKTFQDHPPIEMPGAIPMPQERDFGRVF